MDDRVWAAELFSCDPDRAVAVRFASPVSRSMLTKIAVFDCDLAKALRRAQEPLMQRIQMQFWRDALAADDGGGHPLAQSLRSQTACEFCLPLLNDLIDVHESAVGIADEPGEITRYYSMRQSLLFRIGCTALAGTQKNLLPSHPFFDRCGEIYGEVLFLSRYGVRAGASALVWREKVISLTKGNDSLRPQLSETSSLIRPALLPLALVSTYLALFQKAEYLDVQHVELSPWQRLFRLWWVARSGF